MEQRCAVEKEREAERGPRRVSVRESKVRDARHRSSFKTNLVEVAAKHFATPLEHFALENVRRSKRAARVFFGVHRRSGKKCDAEPPERRRLVLAGRDASLCVAGACRGIFRRVPKCSTTRSPWRFPEEQPERSQSRHVCETIRASRARQRIQSGASNLVL